MHSKNSYPLIVLLLVLCILDMCSFLPAVHADNSAVRTLTWSTVNTPAEGPDNVIRSNCGINSMALGSGIFYCADTENGTLFRSIDGGHSFTDITASLTAAGAHVPVWSVAVAPDDPKFVVAVTDNCSSYPSLTYDGGPRQVFVSTDGGTNWQSGGITVSGSPGPGTDSLGTDEYISCIDISKQYGSGLCDIAVGTRTLTSTTGIGQVLNHQYGSIATPWKSQGITPAAITSLKFSPSYMTDSTLAVISCGTSTALNFGQHDTVYDNTTWNTPLSFANAGAAIVIGTDLSLPYDFNGMNPATQGCFTSIQTDTNFNDPMGRPTKTGVFYINTLIGAVPYTITPPAVVSSGRIYSIAYNGSQSTGILLAGEAKGITVAGQSNGMVAVYQSSNAQSFSPGTATWTGSTDFNSYKSPTGGAYSGRANAILGWGPNGLPYCATSSESDTIGGTAWAPGQWPFSKLTTVPLDESAFSYSSNGGLSWNQISLINTEIRQLSDDTAFEATPNTTQVSVLYLSSLSENTSYFDSVWRSTSDPLGDAWERILINRNMGAGITSILRMNSTVAGSGNALAFGYLTKNLILYTPDEGQTWQQVMAGITSLHDLTFSETGDMYVLEDYRVRQLYLETNWVPGIFANFDLPTPAHSIYVPLTNPPNRDLVFIGTGIDTPGSPGAYVAWTDFALNNPQFTALKMLPQAGNVHVIVDTEFNGNYMIYAGINSDISPSSEGNIYRWTLDQSTDWDELQPPDLAYFGIAMDGDVLYGAFNLNSTTQLNSGGVDRTLEPRVQVPPPPEWDSLTDGLPVEGNTNFPVVFTGEPTSLKTSSTTINNSLWAIDANTYNFDNQQGRLWRYIDSAARVSPWPTAPPSGSLIGADPVTGRSQQIDIKWRPLQDMFGYDLLMAKDVNFTTLLSQNLNMFLVDNITGAWVVGVDNITGKPTLDEWQQSPGAWIPPGVLEAGRSYYWKVRGSRTVTGAAIHSLWSPVMFFSVKPGFAVTSNVNGPELLTPVGGVCNDCQSSVGFSWTPVKNAQKYEFVLANDQALNDVITRVVTTTTAYRYVNKLEPGRIYFWQVKAVAPVVSDPSPTGTFMVSGSQPLISWISIPPSQLWIIVTIAAALLLLLIIAIFIYNYMHRY